MSSPATELADFQNEVLRLALQAEAGSDLRRAMCEAAVWFLQPGPDSDAMAIDPRGGIDRGTVETLLRRVNQVREQGGDPHRHLRKMRDSLERALDLFDLAPE